MNSKSKGHLQLVEPVSATKKGRNGKGISCQTLSAAIEAVRDAESAEDAFYRLRNWSQTKAALTARADHVEEELFRGGMEVQRRLLEENFRSRGLGNVGKALMCKEAESANSNNEQEKDGGETEVRLGYLRVHDREYESVFGTVGVFRQGYGAPGYASIHPLDEQLNLPTRRYSYVVQKRGALRCGRGPFDDAVQELAETTGARVPKRQLEEIVKDASQDFDRFYEERASLVPPPEETGSILVAGVDCKGVPKRKTEEERAQPEPKRLEPGQKRTKKKMATVASVHTTQPYVRTAEEIVASLMDPDSARLSKSEKAPRPEYRRLWASLQKSKDDVIAEVAEEMKRRDPEQHKTAVCVMDGERALKKRALNILKKAFPALIMVLDIIHVLEYLWKAAYAFHPDDREVARLWVRERLLAILQGNVSRVAAGMRQSATKQELSRKKREPVDTACDYFLNNTERMNYDEYLAKGLPIASGAVEGACGHLVKDRMEITGAIWDVQEEGAEAVLRIRALDKSGDFDAYWTFHTQSEHERLYGREWSIAAAA